MLRISDAETMTTPTGDNNFIDNLFNDLFHQQDSELGTPLTLQPIGDAQRVERPVIIINLSNVNTQQQATQEQLLLMPNNNNPHKRKSPSLLDPPYYGDEQPHKRVRSIDGANNNMFYNPVAGEDEDIEASQDSSTADTHTGEKDYKRKESIREDSSSEATRTASPAPGEQEFRYLVCMGNKRNRPKKNAKPKSHPEDKFMMKFSLMK
jgi:hypothetical protein